jgi:GR25 family glycosyltransferase involved in LPS biosynthesis
MAQISLFLKHIQGWKDAQKHQHKHVLIFEDDVILDKIFHEKLEKIIQAIKALPHQFLKILTELGILGLTFFLSFIGAVLFQRTTPFYFDLSLGVLLVWFGTSLFSSYFFTFTEGRFINLWLGLVLACKK